MLNKVGGVAAWGGRRSGGVPSHLPHASCRGLSPPPPPPATCALLRHTCSAPAANTFLYVNYIDGLPSENERKASTLPVRRTKPAILTTRWRCAGRACREHAQLHSCLVAELAHCAHRPRPAQARLPLVAACWLQAPSSPPSPSSCSSWCAEAA